MEKEMKVQMVKFGIIEMAEPGKIDINNSISVTSIDLFM